jgi:hypothetical protein
MIKLAVIILMFLTYGIKAQNIPMSIGIFPDIGFIRSTGLSETLDISHNGTNCKYAVSFDIYSNLVTRWGIRISAPPMVSGDGKDKLDGHLVNYKIYGGTETAVPAQDSNLWLPLPINPTIIYQSNEKKANFRFFVFVTPRTAQMYKTYSTRVLIELVSLQ